MERDLEQSIKLAKEGLLPAQLDSLGRRLRDQDDPPGPTSLDDPDDLPEAFQDVDEWDDE